MSLNLCQFLGNLGQDPDIRFMPDGRAVVNLSIACGERWKDKNTGEIKENTEWVRAVCFGKRAEVIAEHFKKGSQIYVSGKMRTRKWQDQAGQDRYSTEIVVDDFQFIDRKPGNGGEQRAQQQATAYGQGQSGSRAPAQTKGGPDYSNMPPPPPNYDDFDDDIPFG
jgi:single-strand DNA-binding protein